jgi:hypothetical protein
MSGKAQTWLFSSLYITNSRETGISATGISIGTGGAIITVVFKTKLVVRKGN